MRRTIRRIGQCRAAVEPVPAEGRDQLAETEYEDWVRKCDTLADSDRTQIRAHIDRLAQQPLISVVITTYDAPNRFLHEAIASVQGQLYPHWEVCVAADASSAASVKHGQAAAEDPRVKWIRGDQHNHIAAATNFALAMAIGEFVVLIDHDDMLSERALYEIAAELNVRPETDILYSDEDEIDAAGRRCCPYFKPDWNIELMLGHNMVNRLAVYRRALIERTGGMRFGFEDSQNYDLTLRAVAATDAARIRHIPAVLCHRRQRASALFAPHESTNVAARRAIDEFLTSQGVVSAEVGPSPAISAVTRVRWPLPDPAPRVSVIIPTRNEPELLTRSTAGVLLRTDYPDIELVIADNDTTDAEALFLLGRLAQDSRVRVLRCPGPFNYSAINNAAAQVASGVVLVLLNNDVGVIQKDWLREMVSLAVRPGIGAVGAKLRYANDTLQHGGVVLGVGSFSGGPGVAGHYGLGVPAEEAGYQGHLALVRETAAVTGACLAVRKSSYREVGGLDEANLPVAFNDVDLCLRLREAGLRNLWTPFADLYHLESVSRGPDVAADKIERFAREAQYMRDRWGTLLDSDPFYNINFSRADSACRLAFPPRRQRPWLSRVAESGNHNAR